MKKNPEQLSDDGKQIKRAVNRAKTGLFKPFKIGERTYQLKRVQGESYWLLQDDRGYVLSTGAAYPSPVARVDKLTLEDVLAAVQKLQASYAEAVDLMARGW